MTREDMLKQLGLTHEEFKDLLLKLAVLRLSLNESQRAVLDRSLPSPSSAATTFGDDVTAGHLQELFGAEVQGGFAATAMVALQNP